MLDHPLSRDQQATDLAHAPAAAPATATIVPDAPKTAQRTVAGEDDQPDPVPAGRPEVNPDPAPESNPDLQPEIPPVETPSIQRRN